MRFGNDSQTKLEYSRHALRYHGDSALETQASGESSDKREDAQAMTCTGAQDELLHDAEMSRPIPQCEPKLTWPALRAMIPSSTRFESQCG
jgi:hypothetical protein